MAADLPTAALPGRAPGASYLLRVVDGIEQGPVATGLRAGLRALSWLYLAGLTASVAAHRLRVCRRERAACPVIGVGNLTVGGTGKSTATVAIVGWLKEAGCRPAVLSRGYGAHGAAPVRVVSDGVDILLGPDEGGDEPVMLARRLQGVPVLVGRRRPVTARAAVSRFGADVCVLDDAFQVWNLVKDLEIVLLDSRRPFDNGFVLPRGMLREPAAGLRRAHAVVLMDPERAGQEALSALRERVRSLASDALVAEAARAPERLRDLASGDEVGLHWLCGRRVVALSGIGSPEGFEGLLRRLGAEVCPCRYADHHRYTCADLAAAGDVAQTFGASAIVTTEKDGVKLLPHVGIRTSGRPSLPIWVLEIRLRLGAGGEALRKRVVETALGRAAA